MPSNWRSSASGDAFLYFCVQVHFCEPCHNNWSNLTEYSSGTNKKKIWEYPQCPALEKRLKAIGSNSSLSEEQKEKMCKSVYSDPVRVWFGFAVTVPCHSNISFLLCRWLNSVVQGSCPLKVKHPPNGFEFGIGCGLCRGVETKVSTSSPAPAAEDGKEPNEDDEKAAAERAEVSFSAFDPKIFVPQLSSWF